jgi:hypothetical protein
MSKARSADSPASELQRQHEDVLYLFYDLDVCPITYDAASYVATAEIQRRQLGLASIHVVIVPGQLDGLREEPPDYEAVVNLESRRWRLHHVVIAIFRLLPSISGYTICASRAEADLLCKALASHTCPPDYSVRFPKTPGTREVCEAARKGVKVLPMLRATPQALVYVRQFLAPRAKGRRVVVINLRRYGYMPPRNSNDDAWIAFAKSLDPQKWLPVFVLDTDTAHDLRSPQLDGFVICEAAAWNVEIRAALYELADLTMAIAQGPMELCWLNDRCRYAMFVKPNSAPQTSEGVITSHGFEMNTSPPYAVSGQRWIWDTDDLSVIRTVFQDMTRERGTR